MFMGVGGLASFRLLEQKMAGRIKLEIQKNDWEVLVRGKLFLNQRQGREHLAIVWNMKVQTVISMVERKQGRQLEEEDLKTKEE